MNPERHDQTSDGVPGRESSDRHMTWRWFGYVAESRNLINSGTITSGAGP
jgi:hypothetical protein